MSRIDDQSARNLTVVEVFDPLPTPKIAARRLNSIREVRREMSRVYCEARNGTLRTDVATRLIYMLTALSTLIRDSELEQRVAELEQELARR